MQAIEFPFKLGSDKFIKIPARLEKFFSPKQKVRVIILMEEPEENEENAEDWNNLVSTNFLHGYHENDEVYDKL
ncbi:MAG: hypothetical protein KKD31_01565 [Bacteroidetes bacterium]|nr:hypothetical protein [Bacteroidota bacterium]